MALAVNLDVFGRDVFNQPIPGVNEFIGLSIVAVVFLQMANTLQEDRHVSNDIFIRLIATTHPRLSAALYASFHVIGALLMAIIVVYVWPMLVENYTGGYYSGTAGIVEIKIWPFMAVVVIGAATTAVQFLVDAWRLGRRAMRGADGLAMSEIAIGAVCFLASLVLIQSGMHIGVALMLLSFVGVWAIKGFAVAGKLLASSVATSIASDAYAVIPMFVLMGLFVSATNMGRDTFDVAALVLRRIRGALGIATVAANAVFAACTGTTIASASVFTKVAVPEMIRHGHTAKFSVGRGRRQFGARHADPAEHPDDHFRRDRQRLDRRPVHFGHPAGHRARERVLRHNPADVLSEAGTSSPSIRTRSAASITDRWPTRRLGSSSRKSCRSSFWSAPCLAASTAASSRRPRPAAPVRWRLS